MTIFGIIFLGAICVIAHDEFKRKRGIDPITGENYPSPQVLAYRKAKEAGTLVNIEQLKKEIEQEKEDLKMLDERLEDIRRINYN